MKNGFKKLAVMAVAAALTLSLLPVGAASAAEYGADTIKVGLNSPLRSSNPQTPYVTLGNSSGFRIGRYDDRQFVEASRISADEITVSAVSGGFEIRDNDSGEILSFGSENLAIAPVSVSASGTAYTLPDSGYGASAAYYGGFEFVRSSGSSVMTVINYVDTEDYVKCVLPYEMPASWDSEALKAQAVCIRTYALKHLNGYSQYGFDVCNTTYSQVYSGVYTKDGTSYKSRADSAVDSTAGECLLYGGSLIDAVYHAASGGATEDAANVWGTETAYLKGVADSYEQTPSNYSYSGSFTAAELYAALKANISGFSLADIVDVSCEYTAAGNMLSISFTDSAGNTASYTRGDCRTRVLSSFTAYTSQRFTINKEQTTEGERYVISSSGYGHNVGLSQYGAKGMAEAGYTYDKILSHYYTGAALSSGNTQPDEISFTDVAADDWYYAAVEYVVNNGLFQGTDETTFSPNTPMTRAMFVTVLGRAAGVDAGAYEQTNSFTDVPSGQYYTGYVAWAAGQGITNGYDDGGFHPNATITREEMCVLLNRFCRLKNIALNAASVSAFTDSADISSWAIADVSAMQQAKIVSGNESGAFLPKNSCTRAEVAQVLKNFLSQYLIN